MIISLFNTRHYEEIAEACYKSRRDNNSNTLMWYITEMLIKDNKSFDTREFIRKATTNKEVI